jgi:hypothetical protein
MAGQSNLHAVAGGMVSRKQAAVSASVHQPNPGKSQKAAVPIAVKRRIG